QLVQVEVIRGDGDRGEQVDAELVALHRLEPVRKRKPDYRCDGGTDLVEAGAEGGRVPPVDERRFLGDRLCACARRGQRGRRTGGGEQPPEIAPRHIALEFYARGESLP